MANQPLDLYDPEAEEALQNNENILSTLDLNKMYMPDIIRALKRKNPNLTNEQLQQNATNLLSDYHDGKLNADGTSIQTTTLQDSAPVSGQDGSTISKANNQNTSSVSAANPMIQRVRGQLAGNPKHSYADFEQMVSNFGADGKISMSDRRQMRKELGLSRKQMRHIAKDLNGEGSGQALANFTRNGLERRSYVDNGKIVTEGQDGWNEDAFNGAKYKGTDLNALANQYNNDVFAWRKNTEIKYDPTTGKYLMQGFGGTNDIDVSDKEWAKDRLEAARNAWFDANKNGKFEFNSEDGSYSFNGQKMADASWLNEDFTKKLRAQDYVNDVNAYGKSAKFGDTYGVKGDWSKLNKMLNLDADAQKAPDYEEKYRQALDDHLKDYSLKNGSVAGSSLYNYLQEQGLLHVGKGTDVAMNPNHPWLKAQQILSPVNNEMYNLKTGGILNTKKMRNYYKSGGAIKKYWWGGDLLNADTGKAVGGAALEAGKRMIPVYGTYLDWKDFANDPSLANLASAGLSTLGDATMLFGGAGTLFKGMAAARKIGKAADAVNDARKAYKIADEAKKGADAASTAYSAVKGANKTRKAELAAEAAQAGAASTAKQAALNTAEQELNALKATRNAPWNNFKNAYQNPWSTVKNGYNKRQFIGRGMGAVTGAYNYLNPAQNETSAEIPITSQQVAVPQQSTFTPVETSNYQATGNDWFYKQGGNINMNKINYFQDGGAMAPAQAAPAQGGQDIQAQVEQLVQAAMSGDQQATEAINQIMQAAQQGDQQAAQLAQMIQEIAQQMQGAAQAAKRGAKLSYLHSLKTGCPEGTEAKYYKKGGRVCKECVKKGQEGSEIKNAPKVPEASCGKKMKACGGAKATKHAEGGNLENLRAMFNAYRNK